MGLDMYLTGKKFYTTLAGTQRRKDAEGFEIESEIVTLGYWRKHANLHGYIVQTYPEGKDECQDITLDLDAINHLLDVVKNPEEEMPKTEGFFFGESDNSDEQIQDDVAQLTKALAFLTSPLIFEEKGVWRSVIYTASW